MERAQIHIRDNNFFSETYPTRDNPYFEFIWDRQITDSYMTIFTDTFLSDVEDCHSKYKVALLLEPLIINHRIYDYVALNYNKFDLIFTFDKSMIISNKFKYYPYGTSWIPIDERMVYPKSKLISIVASSKRSTYGQLLRHKVIERFKREFPIDVMGGGYKPFKDKIDSVKDYRYSIVIENSQVDSYFTEKIMDCLVVGTIPIYWGCPTITNFFDKEGLITFNDLSELEMIFKNVSDINYYMCRDHISNNFEKAKEYVWFEKYLWENGLKNFFKNSN